MTIIPHSRPRFGASFDAAINRVIRSGTLAMAEQCAKLEDEVKDRLSQAFAVGVDSGTSALMLAIRALKETRKVTRVGIPAFSCNAIGHAVRAAGCEAVMMDCTKDLRLDPGIVATIRDQLDAVVIVHPFGMVEPLIRADWPCPVIEDIAQAAGAEYQGQEVGSFGDITITSFYVTKPWGGAYGGMVLSQSEILCHCVRNMRNADTVSTSDIVYAGNHALSDLHASLARVRLQTADNDQRMRIALALRMDRWFEQSIATPVANRGEGNGYRYLIRCEKDVTDTIANLRNHGVDANRPLSTQPQSNCVQAQESWQRIISLPMLADLSEDEFARMQEAVFTCIH
ncbi:MAG: DegT/DnrJ/EryC1/StrS family aminotransferase [Mariprofundaceae bacterium]